MEVLEEMISLTKKLLSVALAVVLLLGAFPATVFAAGEGFEEIPEVPASVVDPSGPADPSQPVPEVVKTWTVKFFGKDGNVIKTEKVKDGETVATPAAPQVEGFTFVEWQYKKGGNTFDPAAAIHGNCNIIAVYKANPKKEKFTVSFNSNCDIANPASVTVEEGSSVELPRLSREGYTLIGWDGMKPGTSYTPTANVTLKAQWDVNEYTVTFLKADGSVLSTVSVRHGEKISGVPSLSEAGTKDGKTPYEWRAENGVGTDVSVKKDLTFKPRFRANDYILTFDFESSKLTNESKKVTYGEEIGKMPKPTLTDLVFMGFYKDGKKYTAEDRYMWNSDVTLKAHWEDEARIELHIYRNGKTSSAYTEPMVYGVPVNTTFDLSKIDMRDYYTCSNSFKVEGIFDAADWRAYKADENAKPITKIRTIPREQGIVELYVMVTDTNAPKPTTKPADPSNPQTGDDSMILATTTAMLISAGALVMFVYDRKRRNA